MTTEPKPETIPTWGSSADPAQVVRPSDSDIAQGFPPPHAGDKKGIKPIREWFNWLLKNITGNWNYLRSQGGCLPWDKDTTYAQYSCVVGPNGKTYKSLKETQGVDPSTDDGTTWTRWGYEAMDVATEKDVGVVRPDNTTTHVTSDGVLSSSANTPIMTLTENGIGRPDGVTIRMKSGGSGVFEVVQGARSSDLIQTTGFSFKSTGTQTFSFSLSNQMSIPSQNQFYWGNPFYKTGLTFEKGFTYGIYIYDVFGSNYAIIKVDKINIDALDFDIGKLQFIFSYSGTDRQVSVVFSNSTGQVGWRSTHNTSNVQTFLGDVFQDSNQSDPILKHVLYTPPQYTSGAFSKTMPILIPSSPSLFDVSTLWSSGNQFSTLILIEKIIM